MFLNPIKGTTYESKKQLDLPCCQKQRSHFGWRWKVRKTAFEPSVYHPTVRQIKDRKSKSHLSNINI